MEADSPLTADLNKKHSLTEDAEKLMEYYLKKKQNVKLIKNKLPTFDVEIIDARFAGKHWQEEKAFMGNKELREKLRRGNSLIKIGSGEEERLIVARRGISKFFDIKKEHIDTLSSTGEGQFDVKQFQGSSRDLFSQILEPALDSMIQGKQVRVYKTEKANGENCQVTYIEELDAWLVSSKNVAVVFKKSSDFETYTDARYTYALAMSKAWLKLLGKVTDQQAIKDVFKNHTAIGEYCGNEAYQHLVEYPGETILFYALVPKYISGGTICLPPSVSLKVFEKLQIPLVGYEASPPCSTLKEFAGAMKAAYYDTSCRSIKEVGEGLVVYITELDKGSEKVLSLGKVKSVEYRLFRRIREKLKAGPDAFKNLKSGLKELATKFGNPPQEIEYYEKIGIKARAVLDSLEIDAKKACGRFKDLLYLSIKCQEEHRLPTKEEKEKFLSCSATEEDDDEDTGLQAEGSNELAQQTNMEED